MKCKSKWLQEAARKIEESLVQFGYPMWYMKNYMAMTKGSIVGYL